MSFHVNIFHVIFFVYLIDLLRLFTLFMFLILVSGIIAFLYGLWFFGKDLPDYKELSRYNPKVVTRIHAGNGALLAEYAVEKRVFVPINVIPKTVIHAFISAEDKDFYKHLNFLRDRYDFLHLLLAHY